ncbi:MAG: hypothetical protein WA941_05505 [Nitrososphaeraceae archaeon]
MLLQADDYRIIGNDVNIQPLIPSDTKKVRWTAENIPVGFDLKLTR